MNNRKEPEFQPEEQSVLYCGTISSKSVLENRPADCEVLYVNPKKRSRDIAYIISLAKRNGVPVELKPGEAMQGMEKGNGGVILKAKAITIPDLKSIPVPEGQIYYLSGLEDPYNLGSVCRTLYAAGSAMLILPKRDWSASSSILVRASAGAFEKLPIAMVETEEELLAWKDANGLPLYCMDRRDAQSLFETEFDRNSLMVIGGAMRGISSRIASAADYRVYIPYGRDFKNALDTPSAAAVSAFFYLKQFEKEMI